MSIEAMIETLWHWVRTTYTMERKKLTRFLSSKQKGLLIIQRPFFFIGFSLGLRPDLEARFSGTNIFDHRLGIWTDAAPDSECFGRLLHQHAEAIQSNSRSILFTP